MSKSLMSESVPNGRSKPKTTKSRKGCLTCKKKRLKCDETKPACLKCLEKHIECEGYATRFKWRSFNDNNEGDSFEPKFADFKIMTQTSPSASLDKPEKPPVSNELRRKASVDINPPKKDIKEEDINLKPELLHISPPNSNSALTKSPNSLRRHLELASLSITGKSIKDIKLENDLIEEGFDPANYMRRHGLENTSRNNAKLFANLGDSSLHMEHNHHPDSDDSDENPHNKLNRAKRLKRSQSVSDNSILAKPSGMVRSFSTNTGPLPSTVADLRSQYAKANSLGLNSLAEAAIDEINTRSPAPSTGSFHNGGPGPVSHVSALSPSMSDFLIPARSPEVLGQSSKSYSHKSPAASEHRNSVSHNHPSGNRTNHSFLQSHHRLGNANNSSYSDMNLNLSPSLSALINTAFNNDTELKNLNLQDDGFSLDIPLSPLNLQHGDPLHDFIVGASSPPGIKDTFQSHMGSSQLKSHHLSNSPSTGLLAPNSALSKLHDNEEKNRSKNQTPNSNSMSTPLTVSVEHDPVYSVLSTLSIILSAEQEQILGLYSQYTAGILSIKNAPYENPWRNIILPLAFHYSCLFNSIASVTLFHLAGNEAITTNRDNLRARGYMYMKRCILELASGLSASNEGSDSKALPADIALATCLNLAVSETWDKHTSSGIAHLKGAKTMIQNILALLRETQQQLTNKKKELFKNGTPNEKEDYDYINFLKLKKEQLKKKMVFVDDNEWNGLLSGIDETDLSNENNEHQSDNNQSSNTKDKSSNNSNTGEKKKDALIKIPRSTQFLFNVWIYFEVLAQMTTETDEKGVDLVASITSIMHDTKKKGPKSFGSTDDLNDQSPDMKSESSDMTMTNLIESGNGQKGFSNFFENFESFSVNTDEIDPLLGCAQSLFLILGKVATLISKIRKNRKKDANLPVRNTLFTITMATQLRQQLLSWKPTISKSMFEQGNKSANNDPSSSELFSYIATAEAYRFSALLYLHQAVPEIPSSSSHQLAEKIFILLASIPSSSHTYTIHIFPLLVSSCEAEAAEERDWCENRWKLLSNKLWIGNVDRALEVVKEVWRRKDDYIRKKKNNSLNTDDVFISAGSDNDTEKLKSISSQLSGLMAAVNGEQGPVDDITGGIYSKLHWSTIMKEWGWEVLLG